MLDALARFPELRSKLCFLGSDTAAHKLMQRLAGRDKTALANFGLSRIVPDGSIQTVAKITRSCLTGRSETSLACAFSFGGFCDGIILRERGFSPSAYKETLAGLKRAVDSGFNPKGCYTVRSLIDHEIGHTLDYSRAVSERKEVIEYFRSLEPAQIKAGLSAYAATNLSALPSVILSSLL